MTLTAVHTRVRITLLLALVAGGARFASGQISVSPSSINFGSVAVNVQGFAMRVTLTNNTSSRVSLTSISFGIPQYSLSTGLPMQSIPANGSAQFAFLFLATTPGTYNSTATFYINNAPGPVVQLSATAFTTTAVATLSASALDLGTVNMGSTSGQPVTVTNSAPPGSDSVTILGVVSYYQPFSAAGPATPVVLAPGQSATYVANFSPLVSGPTTGSLTFCYDVLPCSGLDLTATGAVPAALSITSYPVLPWATRGFPYQANLAATGGTPPYTYSLVSGKLPSGLSLSSSGAFSGTISSKALVGTFIVTVQVTDSSSPNQTATQQVTVTVDHPTGANCSITSVNVPNTSTPIVDLMDLGAGTYQGQQGGLYPNGTNTDPDPHHSDGVAIAQSIAAMPGPYVMISIGQSASEQAFNQLIEEYNADPERNPSLIVVDGAEGGGTANSWTKKSSGFWTQLISYSLPSAGVTASQVVAAWVNDVNSQQGATFPGDAQELQANYEAIAQLLLQFFPNIKMMFFSSMNYTGYSQGITNTLPEPQAFESAFGAKWAIQDQINGNPKLNYNSANGPVLAPWMGWGFYYWGNGLIPRSDGITWSCQDLDSDGLHPAPPLGHIKIADYLLNWFKTADLSAPWFVVAGAQ